MTAATSFFDRAGARIPDTIFVENRWMEATLPKWTSRNVIFAPPGVDTALFRPREGPVETGGDGYLLSVARFDDPRKRVDLLFQAYAALRRRLASPPDLVLAGASGPPPDVWAEAEELGIRDSIEFRENLSTENLARLYRRAELFVLPSAEEGLGLVFLEAQASGIPVVATRTKGAESAVEHGVTGFLSPVGDVDALVKSLATLMADPEERRRMGVAARQRAEEHFSTEVTASRFLEEYRRLLR